LKTAFAICRLQDHNTWYSLMLSYDFLLTS